MRILKTRNVIFIALLSLMLSFCVTREVRAECQETATDCDKICAGVTACKAHCAEHPDACINNPHCESQDTYAKENCCCGESTPLNSSNTSSSDQSAPVKPPLIFSYEEEVRKKLMCLCQSEEPLCYFDASSSEDARQGYLRCRDVFFKTNPNDPFYASVHKSETVTCNIAPNKPPEPFRGCLKYRSRCDDKIKWWFLTQIVEKEKMVAHGCNPTQGTEFGEWACPASNESWVNALRYLIDFYVGEYWAFPSALDEKHVDEIDFACALEKFYADKKQGLPTNISAYDPTAMKELARECPINPIRFACEPLKLPALPEYNVKTPTRFFKGNGNLGKPSNKSMNFQKSLIEKR